MSGLKEDIPTFARLSEEEDEANDADVARDLAVSVGSRLSRERSRLSRAVVAEEPTGTERFGIEDSGGLDDDDDELDPAVLATEEAESENVVPRGGSEPPAGGSPLVADPARPHNPFVMGAPRKRRPASTAETGEPGGEPPPATPFSAEDLHTSVRQSRAGAAGLPGSRQGGGQAGQQPLDREQQHPRTPMAVPRAPDQGGRIWRGMPFRDLVDALDRLTSGSLERDHLVLSAYEVHVGRMTPRELGVR